MFELNTITDELFGFSILLILPISFILWLWWSNRCPEGGQHKYDTKYGRYVKGNDIGFGVTNSFRYKTCICKKCGYSFETYE